jgi:hypothetical protein
VRDGGDGEKRTFGGGGSDGVSHPLFSQRGGIGVGGNSTLVTTCRFGYRRNIESPR